MVSPSQPSQTAQKDASSSSWAFGLMAIAGGPGFPSEALIVAGPSETMEKEFFHRNSYLCCFAENELRRGSPRIDGSRSFVEDRSGSSAPRHALDLRNPDPQASKTRFIIATGSDELDPEDRGSLLLAIERRAQKAGLRILGSRPAPQLYDAESEESLGAFGPLRPSDKELLDWAGAITERASLGRELPEPVIASTSRPRL